jgi:hypothetical protein
VIRAKRGIQWDKSQIIVQTRSGLFFTHVDLYFDLNNIVVTKWPNS